MNIHPLPWIYNYTQLQAHQKTPWHVLSTFINATGGNTISELTYNEVEVKHFLRDYIDKRV